MSTSTIQTVFGTWTPAVQRPANANIDLERQVVTGFYESGPSTLVVPSPARSLTHAQCADPIDDFFRVSRSSRGTQDSRHDDRRPVVVYQDDVPPPPYAEASDLPAYTAVAEPPTLAMYLFKFGFCKYVLAPCHLTRSNPLLQCFRSSGSQASSFCCAH